MPSNTLPFIYANDQQNLLAEDRKQNLASSVVFRSFLYIGEKNDAVQYFKFYFKTGYYATSFDEAIKQIFKLSVNPSSLPDVILIDTPFKKNQVHTLSFVIKSNFNLSKIPVIYNDRNLDVETIYDLISNDIIDEATNINTWDSSFLGKLKYLKMLKKQQHQCFAKSSTCHLLKGWKKHLNTFCKRAFDIVVSSILLMLLAPVFIAVGIAIKIDSRGPIFYNSYRAGRGFKVFKFFKFRTMEMNADQKTEQLAHLNQYKDSKGQSNFLKISNDPRVTKIGQFLRNTSLDELPQLVNVFIGDMSLVGNRPLPIYEAATLTNNDAVERFMAPAGITGLWQVEKRSNEQMSASDRIELDIEYARKHNFLLDMFILAKTPMAMFQKANV
jgi:lipopolysaccharide/colanic/teichoic acid biosynthesis glycosyltransferase